MNKTPKKARKYSNSKLKGLLDEITPLEMEQAKIKMQLAARIEDCMRDKGWNKSQFAEQVGKNPSEITKWLSGTQNFTLDVLTEIAYALETDLASLLGKPQVQVIYRKEIVVQSEKVPVFIPLITPSEQGIDFENCLFTIGSNQQHQIQA